jgi:hypothetical protein
VFADPGRASTAEIFNLHTTRPDLLVHESAAFQKADDVEKRVIRQENFRDGIPSKASFSITRN